MTYVITSKCERMALCVDVCPTDSIHAVEGAPDWPLYYINPETCIECAACEMECPNEAIYYEDDVPDDYSADIEKNAAFYEEGPGQDLA